MRDAQGFAPQERGLAPQELRDRFVAPRRRIAPAVVAVALLAAAACYVVPRGLDAQFLLSIEDEPAEPRLIETVRGFGYRFTAP